MVVILLVEFAQNECQFTMAKYVVSGIFTGYIWGPLNKSRAFFCVYELLYVLSINFDNFTVFLNRIFF